MRTTSNRIVWSSDGEPPPAAGWESGRSSVSARSSGDGEPGDRGEAPPWKILSVDDDEVFQQSLVFGIGGLRYRGRRLAVQCCGSYAEAVRVLAREPDIAVVLLDVVMETDDAGLRLVKTVRDTLGYGAVRIVLVTGEPGVAPLRESISNLDINDYWTKSDLTVDRLHGVLTANLRSWEQIGALTRARQGLRSIVTVVNELLVSRGEQHFAEIILTGLGRTLGVPGDGLLCVVDANADRAQGGGPIVIGATGEFAQYASRPLKVVGSAVVQDALAESFDRPPGAVIRSSDGFVVTFSTRGEGRFYGAYMRCDVDCEAAVEEILQVFAAGVGSALVNVALVDRLDATAYEDAMLAMPNRNAMLRALADLAADGNLAGHTLAFVDIDDFSGANLALGLEEGDIQLRTVAQRLRSLFRDPVVVARLHDDVFGVLGPSALVTESQLVRVGTPDSPRDIGPEPMSVGVATLDLGLFTGSPSEALAMASLVLKEAKRRGYGQFASYRAGLERTANDRFKLGVALRRAIEDGSIDFALQPQIDLVSGRMTSVEALARWARPDGSPVPPATFVPIAEANGDIHQLGLLMLRKAARAMVALQQAGHTGFRMGVNVSVQQFAREGLVDRYLATLAEEGCAPELFEVEVTESVAMHGFGPVLRTLTAFRDAGLRVAIDDFGTGFSSMAYLRSLPSDKLKIDRTFVQEIGRVADEMVIAEAIIDLGRRVGLRVVAEGVETAEQAAWLRARGCHAAQGFHFARPMTLEDLFSFLRSQEQGHP